MKNEIKNLPEKFVERVRQVVPEEKLAKVFDSFNTKRNTTFRANTLKITADKLEEELHNLQLPIKRIPWYTDAFLLDDNSDEALKMLTDTSLYKEGYFYIQSLSSMIPPLVLDPRQNEKVLDIAAAPGSKTTQMTGMMKNTGEIIANDISPVRIYRLKANIESQAVTNTKVIQMPGQILWEKFPEYFDKVLVDAPCSLEGRINSQDPKTYKDWSPKKAKSLSKRQRFLLRSAISATKPGGIIVYSTCTLSPEENEEVIDWILKKEKNTIEIEPIKIQGLITDEPIMQWKNKTFHPRIQNTLRIFPSNELEGFFVAKIRKLNSTI